MGGGGPEQGLGIGKSQIRASVYMGVHGVYVICKVCMQTHVPSLGGCGRVLPWQGAHHPQCR